MRQYQQRGNHKRRKAAVVLEAVIALPILVIALMAIIEFGLLSARQGVIHAASRAGADAAAAYKSLLPPSEPIPVEVTDAVDRVLAPMGIVPACIRLEHTVGGGPHLLISGAGVASPSGAVPSTDYVRVSVCIENTQLAPNLLRLFFLDLENTFSQQSTCRCVGD